MKVSSRELLTLVAFIALVMASLRVGGFLAVIAFFLTATFCTCLLIVALVGGSS